MMVLASIFKGYYGQHLVLLPDLTGFVPYFFIHYWFRIFVLQSIVEDNIHY